MKKWDEIHNTKFVYLNEEAETEDFNDNVVTLPRFTKCKVEYFEGNEIMLVIASGKLKDKDLYYYTTPGGDSPASLLSEEEYKLLNVSEEKIWIELKKIAKKIESIEVPSDKLKKIKELIES